MGLEADSLGPLYVRIQLPPCDQRILFSMWPRHATGRGALFCDTGVSHAVNLKHFLMNSKAYYEEQD